MSHQNIVAIIQARMGSSRFPGKVLKDIAGHPMLWHVVNRTRRAATLAGVVIASSIATTDDAIAEFCGVHGLACFRGSETDVLDRYYQAAKQSAATAIVRVTGDCPLIDPEVIDRIVGLFVAEGCDYATNTLRYTYPDGLDTEVFSFAALECAWRDTLSAIEREHVTPYLKTSGRFQIRNVENDVDLSGRKFRWTVDEPCDLKFVRAVYERLENQRHFGYRDVIRVLEEEPKLYQINAGRICNEGYYKSFVAEAPVPPRPRLLTRSRELKEKAERLIPGCSQTLSKGPSQYVQGVAPAFLTRGQGSHVWDVDDNEYIDYPMALGPIVLGYGYPAVDEAVKKQLGDGATFSLPHRLEVEVAERMVDMVPCAEMVRYGKNGSDATAGAVRLARAYTGKDLIACCGYHGWQDWYIGSTSFNRGVPKDVRQLTVTFEYNNIESVRQLFAEHPGQIAAVILEPVGVVEPKDGFLVALRELCRREGSLLIFDEVITGFRIARGGAQEYFGVIPDLACFGKAMANGFPISAVVGPRDIMKMFEETFFSFTFGGEALSLAAARATMKEIAERDVIGHLWEQGRQLMDGLNVLAHEFGAGRFLRCIGLPPRTVVNFFDESGQESLLVKSLFQQECLKRGILFSGGHNISYSHSASDIKYTLRVYRSAMELVATAIRDGKIRDKLEGDPVQAVFRRA